MRNLVFVAALLVPQFAMAQSQSVDANVVKQCMADTPVGTVYPGCIGAASDACQMQPGGLTTMGTVECIQAETAVWDQMLNAQYKAVKAGFAAEDKAAAGGDGHIVLADALRDAQRAWIRFRDADCALAYARWQDGSIRSIVSANCMMSMTAQRAIELRDMQDRSQ